MKITPLNADTLTTLRMFKSFLFIGLGFFAGRVITAAQYEAWKPRQPRSQAPSKPKEI
ncbi:hypothetical protein HZB02_04045 [Candidatus Woesearchaeota archaeon]|nr:hypothetical protein [Candidatus Woesearchaeota archaeon]